MTPKNAISRLRIGGVVAIVLTALLLVLLYNINPGRDGFIPCVLHQTTGLYCAGCGTARALHALLHGDIAGALGFNALTTLLLPPLVAGLIASFFARKLPRERTIVIAGGILLALSLVFTVLRNIPAPIFEILRP